jgi:predicted Rossmann-fold nucleotide-binding protein
MEAVSSGAAEAGGHVIGVTAPVLFPSRSGANSFVAELIEATSLANRIDIMMQRSTATLALPGSIGTAAELLISWNTNHILRRAGAEPRVSVAVGSSWKALARALVDSGAFEGDVFWVETVDEGVDRILTGRPD